MTTDPSPRRSSTSSDLDLVHAVSRAFAQSPDVDNAAIRIAAKDGRVSLVGRVATHAQRLAAVDLASRTPGVAEVVTGLTVDDLDLDVVDRTDADIADEVARAIVESTVAVADLQFTVRHRVVTLEGRVRSERDRAALRHAVQDVSGVHFVDNRLALEASSPGADGVEELEPAECLRLLADGGVGRLAVQEASGVDIFPVNYLLHDGKIYFRSGPGVKLIRLTRSPDVAFEVDGHDDVWSWSVVVKGAAKRLDDDEEIRRSGIAEHTTAHVGEKLNYVRITPRQVSGRRFPHAH
jgi:osmotically-inducible protein OsmY/nitroimidazol reductase NimA-like FMN-containing flavoprotein (pyridoxamine 5'-phosphate oxidase superfamily)